MRIKTSRLIIILSWLIAISLYSIPITHSSDLTEGVVAIDLPSSFSRQVINDNDMQILIKENQRCIRCHQKKRLIKDINAITTVGAHVSSEFHNNCTACHRNKGTHPKEEHLATIVPFNADSEIPIFEQNKQCIVCHSPEQLRSIEWTHDTHATKLVCSACHSLHKEFDPIIGINKTFRIGLCATCHEVIQRDKKAKRNNKERVHEYN
ncbi:cytochrome C [Aliivibrio fischeri]|uniref:cytochrome C n=1 Tax=Aliivibrio fischeri TaxID=668 RepID=UPI0012D8E4BB|nr:cytochrome C [Aliivibrio fischeri]MUK26100.1 cytochrome C [Aliivibrio fischeri]MUK33935.1 cytochrome C [Aliivibrio fischeri]